MSVSASILPQKNSDYIVATASGFYLGSGDLNLYIHNFMTRDLPIKPSYHTPVLSVFEIGSSHIAQGGPELTPSLNRPPK